MGLTASGISRTNAAPRRFPGCKAGFQAWLLSLFSILALCLSALGLYGVMAFLVEQRTSEIGLRMALGATRNRIAKLIFREAGRWISMGVALGLLGSWFVTQWLSALLFQIPSRDPLSIAVTVSVLIVVTVTAAWIPARRAAAVDPMVALRSE